MGRLASAGEQPAQLADTPGLNLRERSVAVGTGGEDRVGDSRRQEMLDGQSGPDAIPDLRGRNAEGPSLERADAERFRCRVTAGSGSWDRDELDRLAEFRGVTPLGEGGDVILADQPEDLRARESSPVLTNGINRVAGAAPAEFQVVETKLRVAGEGDAEPLEAERIRGGRRPGLERGACGGDEDDPVEVHFLGGGDGDEEVAEVDGVEGTAVEGNPHGEGGLQQQRLTPVNRRSVA